jgi:hypothetical protein
MGNTFGESEIQVTEFVTSLTVPSVYVAMARNSPVPCRFPMETELGRMVRDCSPVTVPLVPLVLLVLVTVTVTLPDTVPVKPFILAEIVAVPAVTAVTRPVALTVATAGALDAHVAWSVTSSVVEGWPLPWPIVPVAVSCSVPPTVSDTEEGETERVSTSGFEHPAMGSANAARRSAQGET